MSPKSPAEVVASYFDAIRRRDSQVMREVFAPSGELVTPAGTFVGPDAIADFYEVTVFVFDDLEPNPGPIVADGGRVAVEIELRMGGYLTEVADVFTIEDEKITRLAIYLGPSHEA
jgi:ketosteroid isomerase-like protein